MEKRIPKQMTEANIACLYKKGNTQDLENYRPIALLNCLYKILASLIQVRIAKVLDKHIQGTQYGFRKKKSTAEAILLVRRLTEYWEITNNRLILVLLDWEKAFDKVARIGLFEAMERIGIETKLIDLVKMTYKKTQFLVEVDGVSSKWHNQETGIRQGCPLSPYLFLVVMTVMFRDIHDRMHGKLTEN